MSSSRSNAAARQRRAGEAPPMAQRGPGTSINSQQAFAQQQQGNPNNLPPQAPQVPVGKLSVGDAFALVTIRLGRIETIIQKLEAEGVIGPNSQNSSHIAEHDENMRLVDDTVIRNVIARLGDLEKGQTKLSQNKASPELNSEEIYKMVDMQTLDLQNQVTSLKNELRDTKEMLMKLQSFSMETNQKIISVILTQEKQETLWKKAETETETETETDTDNEKNIQSENEETEEAEETEKTEENDVSERNKVNIKNDIANELLKINNDEI